jgi:hypothetical protein
VNFTAGCILLAVVICHEGSMPLWEDKVRRWKLLVWVSEGEQRGEAKRMCLANRTQNVKCIHNQEKKKRKERNILKVK